MRVFGRHVASLLGLCLTCFVCGAEAHADAEVIIVRPAHGAILSSRTLSVSIRIGSDLDEQRAFVNLDGVDLLQALGVIPPFNRAKGEVLLGQDTVSVNHFSYRTRGRGWDAISIMLAGLSQGAHVLEAGAHGPEETRSALSAFEIVGLFGMAPNGPTSSGIASARSQFPSGMRLEGAVAGAPTSGAPADLPGGQLMLPGFSFSARAFLTK